MNNIRIFLFTLVGATLCLLGGYSSSDGQILNSGFGKNKVHYKVFKWATLETEHFTIYFYRGEEQLARNTEKMAERAYQYLSSVLQHQFAHKIPLIIYASSDDFQQTEIIPGFLDEGIGGVTESLRGRIIIPFLGSYRSFNHVLVHELVHGFQFDILSGGQQGVGTSILNIYLPLWFVEGMAEYLSEYNNPLTDMWLQDAVYHETLPEAERLERMQDIRVYRFGQSIWQYICETYGNEITGDLLRGLAEGEKWEQVIQTAAPTTWIAIYNGWRQRIQETYRSDAPGQHPIDEQASVLISHEDKKFSLNIIPAISPNGKYVVFISDRDFYRTIYLASAETGEVITKLVEGERLGTFETLRFLNTSITWAPDNDHIAFNAKGGGENAIYLLNIHTRKIIKKLVPQVSSLSFMAWSPDDTVIAFTGTKHGQEDLFLIDISTAETLQLTNDLYSNRHPSWSPTGKAIAFSTDAGQFSDLSELKFGPSNLAVYEVASGESYLLTDTPANDFTPVWSPDETVIAFISDISGLCNLYLLQLKKNLRQKRLYSVQDTKILTNVNTGVVGLTEDNPALTWAKKSGKLLFSGFSKRGWDIFALENPLKQYQEYLAESGFEEEERSGQWARVSPETIGKKDWGYTLPLREELSEVGDYSARLSPEYILLGGGGNAEGFTLLGRLGFSDLLADRRLSVTLNITEVLNQSDFLLTYTNRSRRLNYALSAFQFGTNSGTFSMKDALLDLEVQRGLGGDLRWPFDKFKRLEIGLEGWMVKGDFVTQDEVEPSDNLYFAVPSLAYVYDTSLYTYLGPLDGKRAKFSFRPAIGNLTYLTLIGDYRQYIHLTRRSAFALRLLSAGSFGENARIFEISGPLFFRGGGFTRYNSDDKILGTKVALGNLEYRFPLVPVVDFLRANIFCDAAIGWGENIQLPDIDESSFFRHEEIRTAFGTGLRMPLNGPFGLINLRFDVAWETDFNQIGPEKFFFSIANDF